MYIAIIIFVVMITPIKLDIIVYYNEKINKLFFGVKLYFITIFSGFITLDKSTVVIHYKNKSAVAFDVKKVFSTNGGVNFFKYVEITDIYLSLNVKNEMNEIIALSLIRQVLIVGFNVFKSYKPFSSVAQDMTIGKQGYNDGLFNAKLLFNLISLIELFFDYLRSKNETKRTNKESS